MKQWSTKPIKSKKESGRFESLLERKLGIVKSGESLPLPEIPTLPKNISPVERPNKEEISKAQKSRFLKL